jgi:deoxyribodipyrimidine photolyase-related protein
MKTLRLILGDQLNRDISALEGIDIRTDVILMAEVMQEATYVRHHKQKIAFILSAMRHFAEELKSEGFQVRYINLDDVENSGSIIGELNRAIKDLSPDLICITTPAEYRLFDQLSNWAKNHPTDVVIRKDDRFFSDINDFEAWAKNRKSLRMEFFYRELRRKTGILMDGNSPKGGKWNFDQSNRKSLPKSFELPDRLKFSPNEKVIDVIALVEEYFSEHFGSLDKFNWAVQRKDALAALDHFIEACLENFGDYQDAMKANNSFLFHSLLAPYINIGLLSPKEVCSKAEAAYDSGRVPINAAEGFIRQILGWREYVRGIYWHRMPGYKESNFFKANRPLPDLYWTGKTDMRCISEAINSTSEYAYAHHIQRLMVTGNFALLAGIDPAETSEWYLSVYADAFEWVEHPNTIGMALYADGGLLASKPYAASGAYINRMSDYCRSCKYDVKKREGSNACPFNYLYWDFMARNQDVLEDNPRMAFPYKTLKRFTEIQRKNISVQAKYFLDNLE